MIFDPDPEIPQRTFHCSTSLGGSQKQVPLFCPQHRSSAIKNSSISPSPLSEHFSVMSQWGCLKRSGTSSAVEISQLWSVLRGRQSARLKFPGIQMLFQIQISFWRKAFQPCKAQTKLMVLCRISPQFPSPNDSGKLTAQNSLHRQDKGF